MATVEEHLRGLSQEVTLAVLPRLYMEEVVTELRRRNISTDTSTTGNCREHLLRILQDVMEQEYHGEGAGASADLDNSLDVLQMPQVETTPGSSPQNSTTVISLPLQRTEGTSHVQATPSVPCSLFKLQAIPESIVQNVTSLSNSIQLPVDAIQTLDSLPASCSTFEGAEVTVEFAIEEVDPTQYTIENSSSEDNDDDGMATTAIPDSATVTENIGWNISSKDGEVDDRINERNTCPDLNDEEPSLQQKIASKQESVSEEGDKILKRKARKRARRSDKPFKCGECSYSTFRKGDLARHEVKHTGDLPFKCDECSYSTVRKSDLEKHGIVHMQTKPFACEQCEYSTLKKGELVKHIKEKHTEEKPFTCDQCDYSTRRESHLVSHKTRHTGDAPFKCDDCSYGTLRKANLARHKLRIHMDPTPVDKSFKCTECSYSTGRKRELARHKLIHTGNIPYKCDQCDYGTLRKSDLDAHMVRHTGIMPFKCNECDYGTGRRIDFKRHLRTHTGEKPFKCGMCDFRAAMKCNVLRHQQKMHKGCKSLPSTVHDSPKENANIDRLYKCKEGAFSTADKADLATHIISHGSGEPNFSDKSGRRNADLTEKIENYSKVEAEDIGLDKMHTSKQVCQTDSVSNNEGTEAKEEAVSVQKEEDEAQESDTSESNTSTLESNFKQLAEHESFQNQTTQRPNSSKATDVEDSQSRDEDVSRSCPTDNMERDGKVGQPFKCEECSYTSYRKQDLDRHKVRHATGKVSFKCAECNYVALKKSDLDKHMVMHTGDLPYKCDQCNYSSMKKSEITRHKVAVHTGKKPYSCLQCEFRTAYKINVLKHIRNHHSSERGSPTSKGENNKGESSKVGQGTEQLQMEDKNSVSIDDATAITDADGRNLKGKEGNAPEGFIPVKSAKGSQPQNKDSKSGKLKRAGKPRSANLYLCEICDYSTHRKDCLVRHMIIHSGAKPYNCKQCEYRAADKSNLIKHIRKHLNVKKQYRCKNCAYTTTVRAEFLIHKMSHAKTYSCPECSYTSKRSSCVTRHRKTHTGEKPYLCDECGFRSSDNSNLLKHKQYYHQSCVCEVCGYTTTKMAEMKRHKKIHKIRSPAKDPEHRSALFDEKSNSQYICEECGYKTNASGHMKYHKYSHTIDCPYVCGECGYRTPHRWNFAKHKFQHTGVKPYRCDVCGYQTARAGDLRRHERTHTGEKPYMCGVCDFRTADKSTLSKHTAIIHRANKEDGAS
ncbi:zinc finger protein 184-like [Branchiostoma floridae]|uniref:Zinc finger protein 184-like n=1 Tax=Branchiostoma floridae TaxID=7739 RepID=A0A9J7HN97_BRAFL|nr:zinc finger protein 184-like [Branchiostoma floridae]XP_035662739.1 zinc finger protein 184-like [Branchiostoma floridae]